MSLFQLWCWAFGHRWESWGVVASFDFRLYVKQQCTTCGQCRLKIEKP